MVAQVVMAVQVCRKRVLMGPLVELDCLLRL
jgi:hypothetical protein